MRDCRGWILRGIRLVGSGGGRRPTHTVGCNDVPVIRRAVRRIPEMTYNRPYQSHASMEENRTTAERSSLSPGAWHRCPARNRLRGESRPAATRSRSPDGPRSDEPVGTAVTAPALPPLPSAASPGVRDEGGRPRALVHLARSYSTLSQKRSVTCRDGPYAGKQTLTQTLVSKRNLEPQTT